MARENPSDQSSRRLRKLSCGSIPCQAVFHHRDCRTPPHAPVPRGRTDRPNAETVYLLLLCEYVASRPRPSLVTGDGPVDNRVRIPPRPTPGQRPKGGFVRPSVFPRQVGILLHSARSRAAPLPRVCARRATQRRCL